MFNSLSNIIKDVIEYAHLPDRVITPNLRYSLFFQADIVVSDKLISAKNEILKSENAYQICMINLTTSRINEMSHIDAFYFDQLTNEDQYRQRLRAGPPQTAWLFGVDCFALASDRGEWCIYADRENDIALISFSESYQLEKYGNALSILGASKIGDLLRSEDSLFPFSNLTETWRTKLLNNYEW